MDTDAFPRFCQQCFPLDWMQMPGFFADAVGSPDSWQNNKFRIYEDNDGIQFAITDGKMFI